jgi:hypothetical protein
LICLTYQQYSRIKQMNKYNIDFFYMHLFTMRCQCVLNRSSNQDAHYSCDKCNTILCLSSRNMIGKTMWEVLWRNISDCYVNLRVEVAAVSRNIRC